mmetsp:Transcript_28258/g.48446  ORF Transcript_28258/g.48446 Transcript_28258/m.48446 type:complete len:247 (+) Transcript_28258:203-943(+)
MLTTNSNDVKPRHLYVSTTVLVHFLATRSSLGLEAKLHEVLVHAEKEVPAVVALVHKAQFVVLQILLQGLGGHGQVVVRDLGEEQVVHHVAVGNVVGEVINAEAERAVNGFESSSNEVPIFVGVHKRLVVVVLQVGDGHQPPAEHNRRSEVVEGETRQAAEEINIETCEGQHGHQTEVALALLLVGALFPHAVRYKRNEVAAIGHAVEIQRPSNIREHHSHPGVLVHHAALAFLGACKALRSVPRV